MKNFLFIILSLFIISCEEPNEEDKNPPTVLITNMKNGDVISEIFEVKIDASDDDEIASVQLFIDGQLSDSTSISENSIYTISWNTDLLDNGEYQVYVKAIDKSNNQANSQVLTLNIKNYRTLTIENLTASYMFVIVNNDENSMFIIDYESSDTISLEKGTDYTVRYETPSFYLQASIIYQEFVENLSVDMISPFSLSDKYFYLASINSTGETIDEIIVNGTSYTSDLDNGNYYEGYHQNQVSNNIRWLNKAGASFYVDDLTEYPVNLTPANPDRYTDRDLFVIYDLPPFSSTSSVSEINDRPKKTNKNLLEDHLKNRTKVNYVRDKNAELH